MLKNIQATFLLLLLGCTSSGLESAQDNTQSINGKSPHAATTQVQKAPASTFIAYLGEKLTVGGLWATVSVFWLGLIKECLRNFINSNLKPFHKTIYVLFAVLANVIFYQCWKALLVILIWKQDRMLIQRPQSPTSSPQVHKPKTDTTPSTSSTNAAKHTHKDSDK